MPNYVKHILANLRQQFGQKQLTELSTYDINFSLEIKGLVKNHLQAPPLLTSMQCVIQKKYYESTNSNKMPE